MAFNIDDFLIKSQKAHASDVHLSCGKTPSLRINGEIYKISQSVLTKDDINHILDKTLPKEFAHKNHEYRDIDYIYEIKGISRFRVNYCKDVYSGKFTFRIIPYQIKPLKDLFLPGYLAELTNISNGIVFITGATGSGKTTTLASMIELINQNHKRHIITIEDPVEFVYEDKKSIITQRSLDLDVKDFHTGIKYALRQDPDVILVGEIRDKATLTAAIEASETGHLVFSTLHTNGTIASINRLKGFIDEAAQPEFMKVLSGCIRGIIHQQLVPTIDGNLVPAVEILTFTSTVIDYVKDGKFIDLYHLMQDSRKPNIVTMNKSLFDMYKRGIISKETAMEHSLEKVEMEQMLRGISRSSKG